MIKSWQELEDFVCEILRCDRPAKPKGSGNAKKEEDVIGDTIIAQCKYTEDKNMSILSKDLDRLIDAAKLHAKIPIFVTANQKNVVISFPVVVNEKSNTTVIEQLVELINVIIIKSRLRKIDILSTTINSLSHLELMNGYSNATTRMINLLINSIKGQNEKVMLKLKTKYDDLTMCDLFEGEKNGTE